MTRVVTFTNLFPSSALPTHGLFVHERMRRVAAAGGFDWRVVAPVPHVAWPLRTKTWRQWAAVPAAERWQDVEIAHPRYRHWPGFTRRQAAAMATGARATVAALAAQGRCVLDAHYLWPDGVAAGLLARELGLPFVLTARGSDVNVLAQDPRIAAAIGEACSRAFACFAVSGDLADRLAGVTKVARSRVHVARNGVDLDRFRPGDAGAARAALGLPATGRLVLGVGRLVASKGFVVAATAVRTLGDARLVLVGDGPERAAIAATDPRTVFLGARAPADVAVAMQAADVLVLPSEREGWPNVVTEALAAGLPVVASRVGGIPEIVGASPPPWLGALCAPRDAASLAAALRGVLASPADRERVRGFAGRYGWDEPVQMLVATFRAAGEAA